MAAEALTDRYARNLHGVLSCYDRIIVTGTPPGACYADEMSSFLHSRGIRIFDYARFAEPLRDRVRERAQEVCQDAGVPIEQVNKSPIRKEDLVTCVLPERGRAPGLVHVISAMEACPSYKPWFDKSSGHVYLRADQGKCLHDYFFFIAVTIAVELQTEGCPAGRAQIAQAEPLVALACALKREGIVPAMASVH